VAEALRAFEDAARQGVDLSPYVDGLFKCWDRGLGLDGTIANGLANVLAAHVVKTEDRTAAKRFFATRPRDHFAEQRLGTAFSFAVNCGGDLMSVVDILLDLGPWARVPLAWHLSRYPASLADMARTITPRAPSLFPAVLRYMVWNAKFLFGARAQDWDPSPAVPVLFGLLASPGSDAATALEDLVRERDTDTTAAADAARAALDAGEQPVLSALLLAQSAIKATPMNLPLLDALCEDPRSEVRLGAVQVVAWAWKRHGDKDGLTHRLAARLDDAAPSVSAKAANEILDGIRRDVVLGDVGADALSRLCRGIESGSESIATFLEEYAASKPERSEGLLAAMSSGTAGGARAAQLARVCSDIVAGRHQPPCRSCGRLGSREEWGERIGEPDVPPPPEFARLRRSAETPEGRELYRCPDCGALFQLQVHEQDHQGGNSTWDWYTLTPWGSPDERSVHDAAASGDVGGLAARLQSADHGTCLTILRTLRPLGRSGIDVRALEPALRQLLASIPDLAMAAAEVLARSLLEADRGQDVDDLLASSRREVVWGVLNALWWTGQANIKRRARFRKVLTLLESDDETTRQWAHAALCTAGGLKSADKRTAAALTRLLDDDRKDVRKSAAGLLSHLAEQGIDIRGAIPKLEDAAAKGSWRAKSAVVEAALSAAGKGHIGPLLDALRTHPGEMALVRGLYHCQERGLNIPAAFEALGASLTSDQIDAPQWALAALKEAVNKGLDVSPAVPGLRHLIARHGAESDRVRAYSGVGAAAILIRQLAQRQEWADLETLLRSLHAEWLPALSWAVRVAVGMARREALLLAARPRKGPAVTEWSARDRHIKVVDSGIVSWRDDSRGGAGDTWSFDEFLEESPTASMRWLWVYDTFGPQVLAEIVEAARTRQTPPPEKVPEKVPRARPSLGREEG